MLLRCSILTVAMLFTACCVDSAACGLATPIVCKESKESKKAVTKVAKKDNTKARYWLLPGLIRY